MIIFAELDWTPGTLQQCEDRAHRIGQKDIVHIHYLVAKNTLDEHVWAALSKKVGVCRRVAQNEDFFEKCVSLCGLVFLLVQKGIKKCFLKK